MARLTTIDAPSPPRSWLNSEPGEMWTFPIDAFWVLNNFHWIVVGVILFNVFGRWALKAWLRQKGSGSVYSGAKGLTDVGIAFLAQQGNATSESRAGERVFRASWGQRLLLLGATPIALLYLEEGGVIMWFMLALLAYAILYSFLHSVRLDDRTITAVSPMFIPKTAPLDALESVRLNTQDQTYNLRFSTGHKLSFMRFISRREDLVKYLERVALSNRLRAEGVDTGQVSQPEIMPQKADRTRRATPARAMADASGTTIKRGRRSVLGRGPRTVN